MVNIKKKLLYFSTLIYSVTFFMIRNVKILISFLLLNIYDKTFCIGNIFIYRLKMKLLIVITKFIVTTNLIVTTKLIVATNLIITTKLIVTTNMYPSLAILRNILLTYL